MIQKYVVCCTSCTGKEYSGHFPRSPRKRQPWDVVASCCSGGCAVSRKSNAEIVLECYRCAAEAHRFVATAADPVTKADFVEIERHWRYLARKYQSEHCTRQTTASAKSR